jgi:hypothetical protein
MRKTKVTGFSIIPELETVMGIIQEKMGIKKSDLFRNMLFAFIASEFMILENEEKDALAMIDFYKQAIKDVQSDMAGARGSERTALEYKINKLEMDKVNVEKKIVSIKAIRLGLEEAKGKCESLKDANTYLFALGSSTAHEYIAKQIYSSKREE